MKLYLVRHGQTEFNQQKKYSGQYDTKLNEKGIKQATQLGKDLKSVQFDGCFTSKLSRSIDTCDIILSQNQYLKPECISLTELNEKDDGVLTGKSFNQAEEEYGLNTVKNWFFGLDQGPPLGESYYDCFQRVKTCFDNDILPVIINKRNVVIVAHLSSLMCLQIYLKNDWLENKEDYKLENCEYCIYNLGGLK